MLVGIHNLQMDKFGGIHSGQMQYKITFSILAIDFLTFESKQTYVNIQIVPYD